MNEKLYRCWMLFKLAYRVIMADKKLLLFPIIAGLAIMILFLTVMAGAFVTVVVQMPDIFTDINPDLARSLVMIDSGWKFGILIFFGTVFAAIIYTCEVAFVSQVYQFMHAQPTSIRRGLIFALGRSPIIVSWALVAATVGVCFAALQQYNSIPAGTMPTVPQCGRMLVAMAAKPLAMAWYVACCFDVALIAAERSINNPWQLLRRSVSTIIKTWGETLLGLGGFYLLWSSAPFSFLLPWAILLVLAISVKVLMLPALILMVLVGLLMFGLIFLVMALEQTYIGLVYLYAKGQLSADDIAREAIPARPIGNAAAGNVIGDTKPEAIIDKETP